jgi:hypothetical protein
MARPSHRPDPALRRQVEAMAGYGVPELDIAGVIGIDPKTLRKHYRAELDHGHVKANVRVAENLYRKATGEGREAVVAAIFWLKTRAGWKETAVHEVTGRHGGPIQTEVSDARQRLAAMVERISARGIALEPPRNRQERDGEAERILGVVPFRRLSRPPDQD